jgi:arabinose-5-phosphate isomerase
MTALRYDLVGIGSVVVDRIKRAEAIVGPDAKGYLLGEDRFVGGVVANHLAWAAALGLRAAAFGRGADDPDGRWLRAEMAKLGVDPTHLAPLPFEGGEGRVRGGSSEQGTAYSDIFVDRTGERAIYQHVGATAETTGEEVRTHWRELIRSARFLSTEISQLPLDAVIAALEIACEAGVPSFLDFDIPPAQALEGGRLGTPEQLERALRLAVYIKPTREAAAGLLGEGGFVSPSPHPSPRRGEGARRAGEGRLSRLAVDFYSRYGNKQGFVAITAASEGAVFCDGGKPVMVPPYPGVKPIDSTGAGDAFFGGMIAGVAYGLDLASIGKLASACGAVCCRTLGAVPVPGESVEQVLALYDGVNIPLSVPSRVARGSDGRLARSGFTFRREGHGGAEQESASEKRLEGVSRMSESEPAVGATGAAARHALRAAASALAGIGGMCDAEPFRSAVKEVLGCLEKGGRIHFCGVGKPGHVADKARATWSSLGIPSYYLNPVDCVHGDSGQVLPGDLIFVISHSGQTKELSPAVECLKRNGARTVGLTSRADSMLARSADVALVYPLAEEGDPLNKAPMASVLVELAILDALASEVSVARGFTERDFRRFHPEGALGG